MNLKQNYGFLAGFLAITTLFSVTGCSTMVPYEESRRGNYFYLSPFAHKPESPQSHWEYAVSLKEKGKRSAARKQFEILQKRWPESMQAAPAKQMVGDLYFADGENQKAFETYEELIQEYYTGLKNYDAVLENQLAIAMAEMERRRMRWMFGGYSAPERAIPYFESILRNAPQWERAPEIQYLIGEAYQKNDELEMAIVAYTTVEYRYPNSTFAEPAAFAKIRCLEKLVEETPYSVDIREQAQLAVGLFGEIYPDSEHLEEVRAFGLDLEERAAQHQYEIGEFYERVPRPAKKDSATIYYRKVLEEHGGTDYAVQSAERLRVLIPVAADVSVAEAESLPAEEPAVGESGEAVARTLPERIAEDDKAVEITADRMAYEGELLIGEGNVAVQQKGASLQANRVEVNPETGEISAEGDIVLMRGADRWEGQELVYNYKTREGTFGESIMHFDPVYITAEKSERVSTNEYRMSGVMMTTCSGESPLLYAKAREVRVLDEDKPSGVFIKAKDVTFYIGPVPVFYVPFWQRHMGYRMFTFSVGYGSRLGGFFMGRAEIHPTDWLTANSHLDLYSRRGVGVGQDFMWNTGHGVGGIKTYYISDGDPYDDDDDALKRGLIDSDRYRVKFHHREQIAEKTYFKTELNWLSDPDMLDDFFRDEFREQANPENYAVVQHSDDAYAAGLRVDRRVNDFYTTVDRIPELKFDWYRSRLGNTPFYFESENSAAFFEMLHSETNLPVFLDYRSGRWDTYNQIFLPLRFGKFFNLIPRAAYRGTWYSETDPATSADAKYRNIFEFGTLASFKAYKTLTDKSGFYGNGLRHVVEPYADYRYRDKPGLEPVDLLQFDSVDELDKENELRFGVRNFIQTKRGGKRLVNFLDADIHTSYRFDRLSGQELFGPLSFDAQMHVTDQFRIQSDAEYDLHSGSFSNANARLRWTTPNDRNEYQFEYRYLADTRSLISASATLFPNANWSYRLLARYDGSMNEWRERGFLVSRRFDCVGLGVGYRSDEDDEHQLWFQLWLTAFDEGSPTTYR